MKNITYDSCDHLETPIGNINLFAKQNKLVSLKIGDTPVEPEKPSAVIRQAKKQLGKYFDGKLKRFELDLDVSGTDFQKAVWGVISRTEFGTSINYAQIANQIANPNAVRAVGQAVGANPIPLIIGCHRILGSDSTITGYSAGSGIATKRQLLELEQIDFRG